MSGGCGQPQSVAQLSPFAHSIFAFQLRYERASFSSTFPSFGQPETSPNVCRRKQGDAKALSAGRMTWREPRARDTFKRAKLRNVATQDHAWRHCPSSHLEKRCRGNIVECSALSGTGIS